MDNGANLQSQVKKPEAPKQKVQKPAAPKPYSAPKRRKAVSLDKRKAKSGWIFVLPFILGLVLIYIPVVVESFKYSLSSMEFNPKVGYVFEFVGLENYIEAFTEDANYVQTLITGIRSLIIDIPAIVIFSLFIAVILNQKVLGRAAFRAIFFIPVICSTGLMGTIAAATATVDGVLADQSQGINTGVQDGFSFNADKIAMMFENMKIGTELAVYVIGAVNSISSIIQRCGVQMLIFLAALQSISPAIYESCSIDGATTWETFWKITLPMISPMILVNTVYTLIDSFTSESNRVMSYIQRVYLQDMVLSAAMAWVYFAIIILLVAVVAAVLRVFVFYQKRD